MNYNTKMDRLWAIALFLAAATWTGCARWQVVHGVIPAEVHMTSIHNVAVLAFEGRYGEVLQRRIHGRLDEVRYFSPVDIGHEQIVGKTVYGQVEDSPELLSALKRLGADALIAGHMTASINDIGGADHVQVQEGTGYFKKEKNVFGQWVDVEIKRTVVRRVPYVIRQGSVDTEYKVLDLRTRRIVTTGRLRETCDKKFGGDREFDSVSRKLNGLPPPSHTANELAGSLAVKLVARLSRMKLARVVKFEKDADMRVKQGVALAERGAWKEAIQLWEQLIHDEPDNASAYYNLGVAYESLGDVKSLKMAGQLYERAASSQDRGLYTEAVTRIKAAMAGISDY
jgi:tetratricopeptide (TPR) repeat protein